jgi:type VI secretion system ImpJ/VasE family protein
MTDDEIIHWETGLFIEPQHFQTMQRQNIQRSISERRLMMPFPYGVVKAELDAEALSLSGGSRVSFKVLHAVMESGLVVNKGQNATVADLDFKEYKGGGTYTIYLLVRGWQAAGRVISDGDDSGFPRNGTEDVTRFRRTWREVPDENTGTDVTSVATRVIDARLVAIGEGDDTPNKATWDAIPITQIIATDPPLQKTDYAPPCFRLSGSEGLKKLVEQIETLAAARIALMSGNLKLPEGAQTLSDVKELLKLQALTIHRSALSHALKTESLTAYDAYGLCLRLFASVCVCGSRSSPTEVVSKYKHHNPWPAFYELYERIEEALPQELTRWVYYDLVAAAPGNDLVQVCTPDLSRVAQGWSCVLAVAADSAGILDQVLQSGNIKVGAPLPLRYRDPAKFISWYLPPTSVVLPTINAPGGVTRFLSLRINPNSDGWRAVVDSRQLGAFYANVGPGDARRLKFGLYLTPPGNVPSPQ